MMAKKRDPKVASCHEIDDRSAARIGVLLLEIRELVFE